MTLNDRKEHFSKAYVRAVAAAAGFVVDQPHDFDSADLVIGAPGAGTTLRSPKVDVQLKCTANVPADPDSVKFGLPVKNYNDLRPVNLLVQKILVVVQVPEDVELWLQHSEEELTIRKCGYWCSLHGANDTFNSETVTITIPRSQQFTREELTAIMERLGRGDRP